jgi:hypothetical protein
MDEPGRIRPASAGQPAHAHPLATGGPAPTPGEQIKKLLARWPLRKDAMKRTAFGNRLKNARRRRGWDTATLAAHLTKAGIDTSPRTIEDWEQGRRSPERFKQQAILSHFMKYKAYSVGIGSIQPYRIKIVYAQNARAARWTLR